jgi:SAM-dependent methyltransferase
MVRWTVYTVNRPIATVRCRVAARRAPRPIALEVGGLTPRPGWFMVNVNAVTPHFMDGTKPWVFEDGALSHVYADNMIEHVPLEGARAFLSEAHRCLRPGGVIRLVTPDVRAHVELYRSGKQVVESDLADIYRDLGVVVEHPVDMVRTPIGEFGHITGYAYDFETLDAELQRAGFAPAVRHQLQESDDPMLRGLEVRPEHGPLQMVLEATR